MRNLVTIRNIYGLPQRVRLQPSCWWHETGVTLDGVTYMSLHFGRRKGTPRVAHVMDDQKLSQYTAMRPSEFQTLWDRLKLIHDPLATDQMTFYDPQREQAQCSVLAGLVRDPVNGCWFAPLPTEHKP